MLNPENEERIDQAIVKFQHIMKMMGEQSQATEKRLSLLYQVSLVAFIVLVVSISFSVIIFAKQMPQMTEAIITMNQYFASITRDMGFMRRNMEVMSQNVDSMPAIVGNIDSIQGNVNTMTGDVDILSAHMATINKNMGHLTLGVSNMRNSFHVMDQSVHQMTRDVDHMSSPMRMFNSMNPFR